MPTNPHLLISAESLRQLRAEHGMTQPQLANAIGMSVQSIKRIERGGAVVFPGTAHKIAALFEVPIAELLTRR